MKERTSVLVEKETLELLRCRAQRHGRTLSEEIRETLDASVAGELPQEELPGAGWLEIAGIIKHASKPASWVDTDEFTEEFADWIERESMGREPKPRVR